MKKLFIVLLQSLMLVSTSVPQGFAAQAQDQQKPKEPKEIDRRKTPLSERPELTLGDVNTQIGMDKRIIVVMAAMNVAGFDYEPGGRQITSLRRQMRDDLKNLKPGLINRLRAYFDSHRFGRTDAAAVAPYLSLALCLTEPPAFIVDVPADRLPEDVKQITDFIPLLEEFYRDAGFSRLLPKYVEAYTRTAMTYGDAAGMALGSVLFYLHTEPVLELPPLFIPRKTAPPRKAAEKKSKDKKAKDEKPVEEPAKEDIYNVPNRLRQFVIMPDLLNSSGAANLRIVRDSYFLLLGPTTEPNLEAIRRAFLSFVIDPLTERQIKEVAAIRNPLRKLMESRGERLDLEYAQRSAYYLITDSLVRAIDARMDVRGIATRRAFSEDEAIYELSLAYDRGAVLVYHFYDQIKAYEAVGVNLRDYFSSLIQNIDFDRESKRLDEYAQRLARYKQLKTEATMAPVPPPTISNADEGLVAQIIEADKMMKARKYPEARGILESALRARPNNARVLFGLAEVTSKQATTLEDSDRVEEALFAAVEYYRQAARNASPESEKWLAQRSYVGAGRILDFIAENNPAMAEKMSVEALAAYEMALKIGKVENGAYDEAEKAVKQRVQKPRQ
jgi:tetratricopeptide (TPR) repeat protein